MDRSGKYPKYDRTLIQDFKPILALIHSVGSLDPDVSIIFHAHFLILVIVCRADGYLKAVLILNLRGRSVSAVEREPLS